jgi:hypothetical protein
LVGIDSVHGTQVNLPWADEGAADPDTITLGLKLVSYKLDDGQEVLTADKARAVVQRVNQIYSQCKIRFRAEEFVSVNPRDLGLPYSLSSMGELDPTRSAFQSSDKLVVINTGNWNHDSMGAGNAWTSMPGYDPPGAVLEATVAANAEIAAHELGHYLNLDHVNNSSNLLNPVVYSNSDDLTSSQCGTMRSAATNLWDEARRS